MIIHVVGPNESIYTIAKKYGIPSSKIIRDNNIMNPNRLVIGQTIVILTQALPHTVNSGESFYSIARNYGLTVSALQKANPKVDPQNLVPGMVLNIPVPSPKLGTIDVNGYAFPTINKDVLQRTLPYLTYLSLFSYEVRPDGSLSTMEDTPLITTARGQRVAPMMVITNIEEGASFSSELAHTILNSEQVQNTLLNNVVTTLKNKNYYGLDIDFEYIFPQDRERYNAFLKKVSQRLKPLGYTLTTALAPKTRADQKGLLYEAHDYPVHGQVADHVILMTYEWGYTYGPAQAVAPINEVKKVLDYAVSVIPSEKILMGMPNYGYDWTLPFVKGSAARTISNTEAVNLASREGAQIQYDTTAQAPYFTYYDDEKKEHIVWFEDARSIEARLKLVDQYNLGGVSYWTINRFFPQNWLVLDSMYDVREVL